MLTRNRAISVLTSIGYVLTITVAALFHDHGGNGGYGCLCPAGWDTQSPAADCAGHNGSRSPPVAPAHHSSNDHCAVCQFLAQKPAPAEDLPPPTIETTVEAVVESAPARTASVVFSAWRSRAPPSVA